MFRVWFTIVACFSINYWYDYKQSISVLFLESRWNILNGSTSPKLATPMRPIRTLSPSTTDIILDRLPLNIKTRHQHSSPRLNPYMRPYIPYHLRQRMWGPIFTSRPRRNNLTYLIVALQDLAFYRSGK